MKRFQTQIASAESLGGVLSPLLENLSVARAQIAVDQIRATIESKSLDRIIFAVAGESDLSERPVAAAIAIHQPGADGKASDMATVIHAGCIERTAESKSKSIIPMLSATMDRALQQRRVQFVQWATDASDTANASVLDWCRGFGFQPIGTLDYLSGPVPQSDQPITATEHHGLRFEPVDLNRSTEFQRFADVVERTYAQTLDCPLLANYRTASQTLSGYQSAGAFDPNLWFHVYGADDVPVGCIVLARHQAQPSTSDASSSLVIEIVYMGLVPEARGRQRGKVLVERAVDAAKACGADRIILGVDQRNQPARAIYETAGLRPMLSETVWAKSLELGKSD